MLPAPSLIPVARTALSKRVTIMEKLTEKLNGIKEPTRIQAELQPEYS